MDKKQFITERTKILSEMLDNPDSIGIYPTTKCFNELDALFDTLLQDNKALREHATHKNNGLQPICQIFIEGEKCTCGLDNLLSSNTPDIKDS